MLPQGRLRTTPPDEILMQETLVRQETMEKMVMTVETMEMAMTDGDDGTHDDGRCRRDHRREHATCSGR